MNTMQGLGSPRIIPTWVHFTFSLLDVAHWTMRYTERILWNVCLQIKNNNKATKTSGKLFGYQRGSSVMEQNGGSKY